MQLSKKERKQQRRTRKAAHRNHVSTKATIRKIIFFRVVELVIFVSAVVFMLHIFSKPKLDISTEAHTSVRLAAKQSGTLLYKSPVTAPTKYAVYWRVFHGGNSSVKRLTSRPEALSAYLRHHDLLYHVNVELFEKWKPERFRVFMEGYDGRGNVLSEIRELEPELATMESLLQRTLHGPNSEEVLEAVRHTLELGGEGALRIFGVQGRFTRYLARSKHPEAEKVLQGADIPGYKPLVASLYERIAVLATAKDDPSDEEIVGLLQWMQEAEAKDAHKRHDYLAERLEELPEGMVCSIILGSSHSEFGKRMEKSRPEFSLEDAAGQVPGLMFETWGDTYFDQLLSQFAVGLTISADSTPKELRQAIEQLRAGLVN